MLKPPESLPFEVVDQMLDDSLWQVCTWLADDDQFIIRAQPFVDGEVAYETNHNQMIDVKYDEDVRLGAECEIIDDDHPDAWLWHSGVTDGPEPLPSEDELDFWVAFGGFPNQNSADYWKRLASQPFTGYNGAGTAPASRSSDADEDRSTAYDHYLFFERQRRRAGIPQDSDAV